MQVVIDAIDAASGIFHNSAVLENTAASCGKAIAGIATDQAILCGIGDVSMDAGWIVAGDDAIPDERRRCPHFHAAGRDVRLVVRDSAEFHQSVSGDEDSGAGIKVGPCNDIARYFAMPDRSGIDSAAAPVAIVAIPAVQVAKHPAVRDQSIIMSQEEPRASACGACTVSLVARDPAICNCGVSHIEAATIVCGVSVGDREATQGHASGYAHASAIPLPVQDCEGRSIQTEQCYRGTYRESIGQEIDAI